MKKTGSLIVFVSATVDRVHLVMHPNEGFDLGLMKVAHPVILCRNIGLEDYLKGGDGDCEEISLDLRNECPAQTIMLGRSLHKLLGHPTEAVLLFDGERLYVHAKPS